MGLKDKMMNKAMKKMMGENITEKLDPSDFKIDINIVNKTDFEDYPKYQHGGDAGFDLKAHIIGEDGDEIRLGPGQRTLIDTGLHIQGIEGYNIEIRPRSGLALKKGLTVLNSPGSVDPNYIGEIKVILINLSDEFHTINHGDRIAQAIISPAMTGRFINFNEVDDLKDTERGSGGFGSTGEK